MKALHSARERTKVLGEVSHGQPDPTWPHRRHPRPDRLQLPPGAAIARLPVRPAIRGGSPPGRLAHSLYARRTGSRVSAITLLLIGGVSQIEDLPRRPRDEALMAFVGPLTSLVIAAILYAAFLAVPRGTGLWEVRFGLAFTSYLNLTLGVCNLLPAFPMDGGRVLRALLVKRRGFLRATRTAALVGKGFALLADGSLAGMLSADDIGRLGPAVRARSLSADFARGVRPPRPDSPVWEALQAMLHAGVPEIAVVSPEGVLLGTISRADIERALRLAELQPSATERSSLRKRMA